MCVGMHIVYQRFEMLNVLYCYEYGCILWQSGIQMLLHSKLSMWIWENAICLQANAKQWCGHWGELCGQWELIRATKVKYVSDSMPIGLFRIDRNSSSDIMNMNYSRYVSVDLLELLILLVLVMAYREGSLCFNVTLLNVLTLYQWCIWFTCVYDLRDCMLYCW